MWKIRNWQQLTCLECFIRLCQSMFFAQVALLVYIMTHMIKCKRKKSNELKASLSEQNKRRYPVRMIKILLLLSMVPTGDSSLSSYLRTLIGAPVLTIVSLQLHELPKCFLKRPSMRSEILDSQVLNNLNFSRCRSQSVLASIKIKDSKDSGSINLQIQKLRKNDLFKGQEGDICPSICIPNQKRCLSFIYQLGTFLSYIVKNLSKLSLLSSYLQVSELS